MLFSSDEEYKTASEGGRRESGDWSEIPVTPPLTKNSGDWAHIKQREHNNWSDNLMHEWSELPPSPPLTRTALSRVKARSRSSSRSRVYKRSRSSPPNSRRSTLDSVKSEDLMMSCDPVDHQDCDNDHEIPNCLPTANDNPRIVELLESHVTLLRDQLGQNQTHSNDLLSIVERQENKIDCLNPFTPVRTEITNSDSENACIRQQKTETVTRDKQVEKLLKTVHRAEQQRKNDLGEHDKIRKYGRDKEIIECKLLESETIIRETTERCKMLSNQLITSHCTVEQLQAEIVSLSDKLSQGIEENERLYARVRDLEGKAGLTAWRERGRSYDSLSDLTNIDLDLDLRGFGKERIMEEFDELRGRFEKAVLEIRAMRKELREANTAHDALELELLAYKQDSARVNDINVAQTELMAARIQDLTNKLAASEKQTRLLRQKCVKTETRDKRRFLSLKGREYFSISQEVEDKLIELENKISAIERDKNNEATTTGPNSLEQQQKDDCKSGLKSLDKTRLRSKSLDSATSSEPLKVLIRLSTLENKVTSVTGNKTRDVDKDSSQSSELSMLSTSQVSMEVFLRLKKLERVILKSKRRLDKCLGSAQPDEKAEKCLRDVNEIISTCVNDCNKRTHTGKQDSSENICAIVQRLKLILTEKIEQLANRRWQLQDIGQLNTTTRLELLAERIAYEFVILRQLKCASISQSLEQGPIVGDLLETSHLISNMECKRNITEPKFYQNTSHIDYVTQTLANKLVFIGNDVRIGTSYELSENLTMNKNETTILLLDKQREINELLQTFKDTKLIKLATSLAAETLSLSDKIDWNGKQLFTGTNKKLLDDRRIREAWAHAQAIVNKEIAQAEVSNVIVHYGQIYGHNITTLTEMCHNFKPFENTSFELWTDDTQKKLRYAMELSIQELTAAYEKSLLLMKNENRSVLIYHDSRALLFEYTQTIAQKALIDARIAVLPATVQQSISKSFTNSIKRDETLDVIDRADNNLFIDTEYLYLLQQFTHECTKQILTNDKSTEVFESIVQSLNCLESDLMQLGRFLRARISHENDNWPRFTPPITNWIGICDKCNELKEYLKRLDDYIKNLTCKQCNILDESMKRLKTEHANELVNLKKNQEHNLIELKGEFNNERKCLMTQYEQEAVNLRQRAWKLEHRLNTIDTEHSAHLDELRAAYQRSINVEFDTDTETRKRYKEEIKQLRALCEKGLLAMENSHRRIILDMEEKHRIELDSLKIEKEQALSEETQATLAALDAMRKAHESEVQREIAKFKQSFLKQMQARDDIGVLHKEHE